MLNHVPVEIDGYTWRIPYWDVDSGCPGPGLLVTGAIHGNEIIGSDAIIRWQREIPASLRRGRLILVPFVCLPAVRVGHQAQNMELGKWQVWPGSATGNSKERLYHALAETVVSEATHAVDIHCWEEFSAATALAWENNPESVDLALAADLPFTRIAATDQQNTELPPKATVPLCTLGRYLNTSGRVAFTMELSGQWRLFPEQAQLGLEALRRVAAHLGMTAAIEAPADSTVIHTPRDDHRKRMIKANAYGMLSTLYKKPGDRVAENEPIADWLDEETLEIEPLRAPVSGRIFQLGPHHEDRALQITSLHPYVGPGVLLAVIYADGDR